nr:GLPGLI family protein [Porphyromonas macacae]
MPKGYSFFRGRTYEAWFTPQIPLKEGPYKFDGLPGLILQIMDTQKHYIFDCVGIEKVKREEKIVFWNWMTQETSREKLNSLIKRFHEQPASVAESLGIKISFRDNSGNDKSKKSVSYPYNPIELE